MHGKGIEGDDPMAEMNMIPLIDIALTLVIILMVTTAFIKHPGISLKLPETVTREGAPQNNKDTVIAVTADGRYYVDGQRLAVPQLRARLAQVAARDRQARIMVRGDRAAAYARVMDVMDMVRQAGLTRVVFPTEPKVPGADAQPARTGTQTARR